MRTLRKNLLTYGAALAAVIAATLIRVALAPLVGYAVPFATYFVAAIFLAWYGGFWPAACSVPISAWLGAHYVLSSGAPSEQASIISFVLLSLAVSFIIDFQRRTLERASAAEKELKKSNEELKRANRDLELFAYSAGHDLREPLRTITISAELIERSLPDRQPDHELVAQIITASERMNLLIQDVLAYVGAATVDPEPARPVETKRVLDDVLAQMQGSIMASGAAVTAGELPVIVVHESRLAQLLQNLISNAIKYRGADPPRIHVDAREQNNAWVFSVTDNGIGIEEQFSQKIFALFKRLHTQEQYEGSGMGLAICQRIVEQYGARIWLERSQPGHGSTFCFSIPIQPPRTR
jgi:light-regulated signal transduction histidine kinase (bacteriophytochrome)